MTSKSADAAVVDLCTPPKVFNNGCKKYPVELLDDSPMDDSPIDSLSRHLRRTSLQSTSDSQRDTSEAEDDWRFFDSLFRGSPSSIFQSPSPVLLRQYRNQASGSNRNTTGTEKEKERRDNSKTSKTSNKNKNKKGTSNNTTGSVVNDSDVEVIEPSVQAVRDDPFAKSSSSDNGDNEIECTGTSGMNAIVDFPHHRDLCVIYKFSEGNHASFCEKCYCVVCEIPASECKSWNLHCDRRNSHYKEREAEQQRHEDGALARLESLHGNRTMD